MAHEVFISYASQDKAVADAMCATLEARQIRCWMAPRDILPGIPYAEALRRGTVQTDIVAEIDRYPERAATLIDERLAPIS